MTRRTLIGALRGAAIAVMRGHDPKSETVRNLALTCLAGHGAADLMKGVGLRALRRTGGRVALRLGRAVPLVGGLIGGSVDAATCRVVGSAAKVIFARSSRGEA